MAKTSALVLALLCVVLAVSPMTVHCNSQKQIIQLFAFTILNGPEVNIVAVAAPGPGPLPPIDSNAFGLTEVFDFLLSESPDSNAPIVGRLQGIFVGSSKNGTRVYITQSAIIESGKYPKGTVEIQGSLTKYGSSTNGEAAVTGGTGEYRFFGGYVDINVFSQTSNTVVTSLKFELKEFAR